ncbi:glycosyltransferase [Sphingobacterium faecium]|uniref:glycosyltransferase n=1 Tax=Sphingobacterium faecium TaxID=34087 RepID=UPI00320B0292
MRILHVVNGLGTGGAEKLIVDIVPLIVVKGHVVDVLLLNGENTPFLKELRELGCCTIISLGFSFYNPFYIFKIIPYLKKYDLVHVHLFPSMYFVALAKLISFSKTKIIFTEHNTSNSRMKNLFMYPLERCIYSQYHSVICITESVQQVLMRKFAFFKNKFKVVENGIDIHRVQTVIGYDRDKFGYIEKDRLICMVAGFRVQKDQDTVVKALKLLPIGYKIIFIGTGDRLEEVKALARTLDVLERITFLGLRTDVISLIKMCDIVVLSSHWEGFGLAAVEGMACGVPVVASDVDGLAQVVSGGGLLFEKGNAKELANKIRSLEDSAYYEKICLAGIEKAGNYDISIMINKTMVLYHSVFDQSRKDINKPV